jgi:ubiquinone biosynthesis protein UbiJ
LSTSGSFNTFETLLTDALAELANASLNLDPSSAARLSKLDGRSIRIIAEFPPPLSARHFTLRIESARMRLYPYEIADPNVIIEGPVPELARWLQTGESAAAGRPQGRPQGRLRIDGDTTVLQEVSDLFSGFAPDLSAPLSGFIGAGAADNLLGMGELAIAGLRSALEGIGGSLRQSASERFVSRPQLDQLLDSIDDMRLRVDRLAARVGAEEARRQSS